MKIKCPRAFGIVSIRLEFQLLLRPDGTSKGYGMMEFDEDENLDLDKGKGKVAVNSLAARNAAGTSIADNPRATQNSLVTEKPAGRSSRRGEATNAAQDPDRRGVGHDLKKTVNRSGRSGNGSGSTVPAGRGVLRNTSVCVCVRV